MEKQNNYPNKYDNFLINLNFLNEKIINEIKDKNFELILSLVEKRSKLINIIKIKNINSHYLKEKLELDHKKIIELLENFKKITDDEIKKIKKVRKLHQHYKFKD